VHRRKTHSQYRSAGQIFRSLPLSAKSLVGNSLAILRDRRMHMRESSSSPLTTDLRRLSILALYNGVGDIRLPSSHICIEYSSSFIAAFETIQETPVRCTHIHKRYGVNREQKRSSCESIICIVTSSTIRRRLIGLIHG